MLVIDGNKVHIFCYVDTISTEWMNGAQMQNGLIRK